MEIRLTSAQGPATVLHGITFDVHEGEVVGLVGRSGTGKTTLLRALGGLVGVHRGRIAFEERTVSRPPRDVVMVFQDYENALLPWRTVGRNVQLGLEGRSSRAARRAAAARALELVELGGRYDDYPFRMSGGMAQRVQIARALAVEPAVLLMDEPFGALDAMTKATLQDMLLDVQRATGKTIFFVTHDLDEAIYLSDRVLVLSGAPGVVTLDLPVHLPRRRDQVSTRESPAYLDLRRALAEHLRSGG
ncbi:MAG: ABC transporter ATP-binding protein [Actinomycetota bacterium]